MGFTISGWQKMFIVSCYLYAKVLLGYYYQVLDIITKS